MPAKRSLDSLRTWVEIDRDAVRRNLRTFRRLVGRRVKLWAVVKSNAYGHGLYAFPQIAERSGADGFCVDSVVEGLSLRRSGIRKPIIALGPTLPPRFPHASANNIAVSISTFESLRAIAQAKRPPKFHLKFDTGMRRQGFFERDTRRVLRILTANRKSQITNRFEGVFTHFATAKNLRDTAYTKAQLVEFEAAIATLRKAGFRNLVRHASATGGTLLGPEYHLDAVRVGIGLYGLWPSEELEHQLGSRIRLAPVLSWRTAVAEVKRLAPGDRVGYDLTERIRRPTLAAVLPVGYWHGYPRALSSIGDALIRGRRCRVLGRVSMAMIVVDATAARARFGDQAYLIGGRGRGALRAGEVAARAGTIHYELLSRLNPLMERVVT